MIPVTLDADLENAGFITNELQDCPFCGRRNPLSGGEQNEVTGIIVYKVFCTNIFDCGAIIFRQGKTPEEARQNAVNSWNTRFSPPSAQ